MDGVTPPSSGRVAARNADTASTAMDGAASLQSSFPVRPEADAFSQDPDEQGDDALDKFAHTRGKRKRTSREDFAILEAEYQRNSRPDKATRTATVARVSLSEKEVQIWFQNRRQMTRRKCRTWQPNEITSIIRSSQEQTGPTASEHGAASSEGTVSHVRERARSCSLPPDSWKIETSESIFSRSSSQLLVAEPSSEANTMQPENQSTSVPATDSQGSENVSDVSNLGAKGIPEESADVSKQATEYTDPKRRPALKRKSSAVRLSLSFDGKAEVVLGSDSPSPPKKPTLEAGRSTRWPQLQRSQSIITLTTETEAPLGVDVPEWRRSRAPGRSRDARTWEFYCDSDARNALTKNAEHDQNGSAQAVLGLLRSGSNSRKPLTPVRRENTPLQRTESTPKPAATTKVAPSRAKLSRAMSSLARLQTPKAKERAVKPKKTKLGAEVEVWQDNFGDSDKENQDPDDDSHHRGSSQGSFGASLPASAGGAAGEDKENHASASPLKQPQAEDELDAVQNLLSLSQGAWR